MQKEMRRQIWILAGAVLVVSVALGYATVTMDVPEPVTRWLPVLIALAVGVGVLAFVRRQAAGMLTPTADADLAWRTAVLCAAVGRPDLQVTVVTGRDLPVLQLRGQRLLISSLTGNLLTDEELQVMIAYLAASIRHSGWRQLTSQAIPPLVLAALGLILAVVFSLPGLLILGLMLAAGVYSLLARRFWRRGPVHGAVADFLQAGGDGRALLAAQMKVIGRVIAVGYPQATASYRRTIGIIAGVAGIPPAEARRIGETCGAPPILYQEGVQVPPDPGQRLLRNLVLYLVLLVLSIAVAVLSQPQ